MCPREGTKLAKGTALTSLRTLCLSGLVRRRPRNDLTGPYSFLKRGSWEGGAEFFSLTPSARTCGNSWNLNPSGKVQIWPKQTFSLLKGWWNPGTDFLQKWSVSCACQCWRGIWMMPLKPCFNFWSVLKWSGGWTRCLWWVPSNWPILMCSMKFFQFTVWEQNRTWTQETGDHSRTSLYQIQSSIM